MSAQYRSFDGLAEEQHKNEVYAVHWLKSGSTVSGSLDGQIKIWDTNLDDARLGSLNQDSPHRCVKSISSSGNRVLASDILGMVTLWNVGTAERGEVGDDIDENRSTMSTMSMVAQKNLTEAASVKTTDQNGRKSEHRGTTCFASQIHPDGTVFASTGSRGGLSIYASSDAESDEAEGSFGNFRAYYCDTHQPADTDKEYFGQAIRFDEKGDKVAVATDKGRVTIYDVRNGATLESIQGHPCITRAVEFLTSGEILIGSDQNSVALYDLRAPFTGRDDEAISLDRGLRASYVDTLKGHTFWITDVKVSSDQRNIATSSADGYIKIWDHRNRGIIFQTREERPVWSLSWGQGSSSFVSGSGSGIVEKTKGVSGNVRWYQISGTSA